MNTKQRVLEQSLRLFSARGYDAVSIREIAGAVGIRESSLYNHFKSKQELFEAVVEDCAQKADAHFEKLSLPVDAGGDLSMYRNIDVTLLTGLVISVFSYFFEDPLTNMFRKLLTLSQFENEEIRRLYRKFYYEQPLAFQSSVFQMLMDAGEFRQGNPRAVALAFYSPVFLLLHTCDNMEEAKPILEEHVRQFVASHRL